LLLICTEERQPDLIHDVPSDYRLPVHGGGQAPGQEVGKVFLMAAE
jgi:hypothetical protein